MYKIRPKVPGQKKSHTLSKKLIKTLKHVGKQNTIFVEDVIVPADYSRSRNTSS
jgi:hypothetical protein